MVFDKVELLLMIALAFQQLADRAKMVGAMCEGRFARSIQRIGRVFFGKTLEADECTDCLHATCLRYRFTPLARVGTKSRDLTQQQDPASLPKSQVLALLMARDFPTRSQQKAQKL
jgi:hypothetical protein